MSKADTLLKRATFFERMALYSDRKTFLQAIAQEQPGYEWNRMEQTEKDIDKPAVLDKQSRDLLYKAMKILQDNGLAATAVGNAVIFNKVDWNAIKQEINQATMIGLSPLGKGPEISELKNILNQLSAKTPVSVAPQQSATVEGRPPARALPPIARADQQALLHFVTEEGLGFVEPSKMNDGALGPETRKALNLVKNYFHNTYPQSYPRPDSMTDQQAITAAKTPKPTR